MTKIKFNYEQYLRILVALKRAFVPLARDLVLGNKKKKIDRCLSELREILRESEGDEMVYMIGHLCYMQMCYSRNGMEKYFRPSTLWRPNHFSGYMEDTTTPYLNRAREVIRIDETRDCAEKFILPISFVLEDFAAEKFLLTTFREGTGMAVHETEVNLTIARNYMGLEGLPQGKELVAVLKTICAHADDPKYITFKSLIADTDRVYRTHSSKKPVVPPPIHKVADPDGFKATYRFIKAKHKTVSVAAVNEELIGNRALRFINDAETMGYEITP